MARRGFCLRCWGCPCRGRSAVECAFSGAYTLAQFARPGGVGDVAGTTRHGGSRNRGVERRGHGRTCALEDGAGRTRRGSSVRNRWVGHTVELAIGAHHRRRLRRCGRLEQLDPPSDSLWAAGDSPPREGNTLDVLIDGQQALPSIAEALAGLARTFTLPAGTSRPSSV